MPSDTGTRLLVDGDRVTAMGVVVSVPGRPVRFCAAVDRPFLDFTPGQEPTPAYCAKGVDATGIDLANLAHRIETAGAIEGRATLTGTLEGDVLRVQEQTASPSVQTEARFQASEPPCAAPEGGWPRDPNKSVEGGNQADADLNLHAQQPALDAYRSAHPGQFVEIAYLRPYADSQVLGVIAPDAAARDAVDRGLRPAYGPHLCVVVSRYTRSQVAAATTAVDGSGPMWATGLVFGSGQTIDDDLQVAFEVRVVRVTHELRQLAEDHPDGLVRLQSWLAPA